MKHFAFLFIAVAAAAAESPYTAELTAQGTEWTICHKGQSLLVYSFGPQKCKPYVKELATLGGRNVLRDAPLDHLHHHGLMYAIKVNGVNFWEEKKDPGTQKTIETSKPEFDASKAVLRQTLHWIAPNDAAPLLIERRTITLQVNESAKEVALRWQADFQVGSKTNIVTLTGANYHGLGMRFIQDFDPILKHLNDDGVASANGKQEVARHKWSAGLVDAPSGPVTVALFGHSSNTRGDAAFFTMGPKPFAYISATQNLDKEPLVYKTGETFSLDYLVTLYPELKTTDVLNARWQRWEKSKQ